MGTPEENNWVSGQYIGAQVPYKHLPRQIAFRSDSMSSRNPDATGTCPQIDTTSKINARFSHLDTICFAFHQKYPIILYIFNSPISITVTADKSSTIRTELDTCNLLLFSVFNANHFPEISPLVELGVIMSSSGFRVGQWIINRIH